MVKIELGKRDFVWIGLLIVLVGVGFVYGYNSGLSPSVMGHSFGEVSIDNEFCKSVTGYDCGNIAINDDFCTGVTGHGCGYDKDDVAPSVPVTYKSCPAQDVRWYYDYCVGSIPAAAHGGALTVGTPASDRGFLRQIIGEDLFL